MSHRHADTHVASAGINAPASTAPVNAAGAPARKVRDPRLDFFRGIAMIVILIAHITDNPWTLWMPGRFGFSDSTEIFVFCSGMASALAWGGLFHRSWLMGALRVAHRVWQVYWVHVGLFFATLFAMLLINQSGYFARDEVQALNLQHFINNTTGNLLGLMTLTYVPNYFDILPMYMVLLAMLPVMVGLARIDGRLALLASVALWAVATTGANTGWLQLPAEWWFTKPSTRPWFFNPFAWQLLFFTGYGLIAGWLPVPEARREVTWIAVAVVVLTVPFAWYKVIGAFEGMQAWRVEWRLFYDKSGFGFLRYVHFLSLAWLAWVWAGPAGARLKALNERRPHVTGFILDIGRQSLAVFAASMLLARVLGAMLHAMGYGVIATAFINILGIALIWAVARVTAWFKSEGWKRGAGMTPPAASGPAPQVAPSAARASLAPVGILAPSAARSAQEYNA